MTTLTHRLAEVLQTALYKKYEVWEAEARALLAEVERGEAEAKETLSKCCKAKLSKEMEGYPYVYCQKCGMPNDVTPQSGSGVGECRCECLACDQGNDCEHCYSVIPCSVLLSPPAQQPVAEKAEGWDGLEAIRDIVYNSSMGMPYAEHNLLPVIQEALAAKEREVEKRVAREKIRIIWSQPYKVLLAASKSLPPTE